MAIARETVRIRWEIWLAAKSYGRVGIGRALPVFRTQAQDLHCCCWSMAMNWPFLTTCKTDQSYPGLFTFSNPPDALVTLHSTLLVGLDKWLKRRLRWWKGEKMHQFPAQSALLLHDQVLSGIWLQHNLIPYQKKAFSSPPTVFSVHPLALGRLRSMQREKGMLSGTCVVELSHMRPHLRMVFMVI